MSIEEVERIILKHETLFSDNQNFFLKQYSWTVNDWRECLQMMHDTWRRQFFKTQDKKKCLKNLIEWWYLSDLKKSQKKDEIHLQIAQDIKKLNVLSPDENWAFITIGWNEQTITPQSMLTVSQRIAELKYFNSVQFVLEKHRENGIHHHTHFLVKLNDSDQKIFKSKLIDWLYQTRGMRAICLGKNFIDILGPLNKKKPHGTLDEYEKYIRGEKKEEKLKYVELDKIWRKKNNFRDIYGILSSP